MAKNPDFERKHPRDPADGQFVDNPGSAWAAGISDQIEKARQTAAANWMIGPDGNPIPIDSGDTTPHGGGEIADALEQRRQALREQALDAFNPKAALTREIAKLYQQLDLPDEGRIAEHVQYAQGQDLQIPIGDYQLDSALVNYTREIDHAAANHLRDKLGEIDPDQTRFPETWDSLDEIDDIWDEGQYD